MCVTKTRTTCARRRNDGIEPKRIQKQRRKNNGHRYQYGWIYIRTKGKEQENPRSTKVRWEHVAGFWLVLSLLTQDYPVVFN
jgi:hypothetical protein